MVYLLLLLALPLAAQESTIEIDNAWVKALRVKLAPHSMLASRMHPEWRDYMKHQTENIGDKQAVEIQIELK